MFRYGERPPSCIKLTTLTIVISLEISNFARK